jgi:regulator of replication initiation timing
MPKKIIESEYIEREEVKAVITLFESSNVLQYCDVRRDIGLKKSEFLPFDVRPVNHEVELVRILRRLVDFGFLLKSVVGRKSYYRLNPSKFKTKKREFADIKKDKSGMERELIEYREQNMQLILENAELKERLAQYEGSWAAAPD